MRDVLSWQTGIWHHSNLRCCPSDQKHLRSRHSDQTGGWLPCSGLQMPFPLFFCQSRSKRTVGSEFSLLLHACSMYLQTYLQTYNAVRVRDCSECFTSRLKTPYCGLHILELSLLVLGLLHKHKTQRLMPLGTQLISFGLWRCHPRNHPRTPANKRLNMTEAQKPQLGPRLHCEGCNMPIGRGLASPLAAALLCCPGLWYRIQGGHLTKRDPVLKGHDILFSVYQSVPFGLRLWCTPGIFLQSSLQQGFLQVLRGHLPACARPSGREVSSAIRQPLL